MSRTTNFAVRAVVMIVMSYLATIGATFNGIVDPSIQGFTLTTLGVMVAVWFVARWLRGWRWHQSPLDWAILIWVAAFSLSLLANLDAWRHISIGLWFAGVYIGLWYLLSDVLTNSAARRETIIEGVLLSGIIVILFVFFQLVPWFQQLLTYGTDGFFLPRPGGRMGNPNFLGAYLAVLIPLIVSRLFTTRSFNRVLLGIYLLLALFILLLTYSRGAWIGAATGMVVCAGLSLSRTGGITLRGTLDWWRRQTGTRRVVMNAAAGISVIVVATVGIVLIRSLSEGGRAVGLRTELYRAAIELFQEQPLTGQGLFTYGREMLRLEDILQDRPHSHAHNIAFQIAAELGIIGLIAGAASVVVSGFAVKSNWRAANPRMRPHLAGATGGVVAFAIHQFFDVTAMMPIIALMGLLALALAIVPLTPQVATAKWRRWVFPAGSAALWVGLMVSGLWSSGVYREYTQVLNDVGATRAYGEGARRLNGVVEADPALSLYPFQQGFLYGMAANEGDAEALPLAEAAFQRFVDLEPGYSFGWANLAALKWQAGDSEAALTSIRRAIQIDSGVWYFYWMLAHYQAKVGDSAGAEQSFNEVLRLNPDASLYPEESKPVARSADPKDMSAVSQVVVLLDAGQPEQADALWQANRVWGSGPGLVVEAVVALALGDRPRAVQALEQAENWTFDEIDRAWFQVGTARLAQFDGDLTTMQQDIEAARISARPGPLDADDEALLSIAYAQFMRTVIPRFFLPQANYPMGSPILLYLIDHTG
ncbi:MAG: O-antigen ligase family protein [Anaerolineae bacterium]|nr:O-antigen ligase family protein [Anaerolineae bacterium]